MRRLDEALNDLAEQDERLSTGDLITGIEMRLSGESGAHVVAMAGTSTMDTDEKTQQVRRRRWVPAVVAVGAAFAVLIAVGLPVLFVGGDDSIVVVEPATTTTSAISTTVTTVPVLPAPPLVDAWQRVGAGVMNPVVGLFDITVADSRLVALGFDPGDDYRQDGVVFVSENGVDWTRLAADDPALTTGTVLIYGVAEGGPGLVAGGMSCEDAEFPCLAGPYPTVWTSTDGTAWTRTVVEQGDNFGAINDVLVTDHGIIAVGGLTEPTPEGGTTSSPVVWLSTDGTDWSRVWQGAGVPDAEFGSGPGPNVLALGPDGLIVGAGSAYNESGESVAAVWVSSNGTDWARVDPDSPQFTSDAGQAAYMLDVVWGPAGFVAVGGDGGARAAVWTSTDGSTWTRIDTTQSPIVSAASLSAVAALDNGYVAAGPDGFVDRAESPVTIWTSTDGTSWDRVQVLGSGHVQAIVSTAGGIAIAGQAPANNDYHAAVWMGPASDPTQPPPDPTPQSQEALTPAAPGIESVPAGRSCEAIAADGFSYAEAVSYWVRHEMPADLDPDDNGMPCEDRYSATDIAGVFGAPEATLVRIVSALPDDPEGRIFVNTGPAVDAGLICPTGTTEWVNEPAARKGALFRWEDRFTCADGSGTFVLGADVFAEVGGTEYGIWSIVSGTGTYESLRGGGGGKTGPGESIVWADDLAGRLWLETEDN